MLRKSLILTLCSLSAFAMHNAELNINDKDVEAALLFDVGQYNYAVEPSAYFVGLRILSGDKKHSDLPDPDILAELSFLLQHASQSFGGFSFGMGVKLDYTEIASETYLALPLGLEASYRFHPVEALPVTVGAAFYYAPEPLAFNSAKQYREYRVHLDLQLIENGALTFGYRNIETDHKDTDLNYNDSAYVGFKFSF